LLGKDGNEGIKRIFDQGLNAAISGEINIKVYDMLAGLGKAPKSPSRDGFAKR